MGSYSSSSSSSTNIDKRQVVDAGAMGITADSSGSSNLTISVLDAGAIDRAFDFAKFNAGEFTDSFEKLLTFAGQAMNMTQDNAKVAELAADKVAQAYEGATGQKIILYGVLALGALWLINRRRGA